MTLKKFKACLSQLRAEARGKSFATHPDLFKDIESLKAKMFAIHGKPES